MLLSGLTGLDHVAGLATPTGQTGLPGIRVQLELFVDLDLNRIFCGINPPHPINIKGHGRLGYPIDQINTTFTFLLFSCPSFSNLLFVVPLSSLRRLRAF